jgi:hypothetical protein
MTELRKEAGHNDFMEVKELDCCKKKQLSNCVKKHLIGAGLCQSALGLKV